jgi:alpha-D-ribose 1-methylphosphonate 5-triphosphate synthase subunit PhnL
MQRREYVGDTTTLSELMAKSVDTKYEAQLQLYDELNLSLEEKDQAAFMEMLESEKNRSSRSINFFKNLEENPDMAEAWLKLSSGMRRGEGGGGRRDN